MILEQYNRLIPTFAQDLHREVMKESRHRRSVDNWLIKGGTLRGLFGQVCAVAIALFGLYVAWQLGLAGKEVAAAIIAAVDLVGLVSVFLGQRYWASQEKGDAQDETSPHLITQNDNPQTEESIEA